MIKDRIVKLLENRNIPKGVFFSKIGMTTANFRGEARKTPLNSNTIVNILSELPDISAEWLLTGKGEMLKSNVSTFTEEPTALKAQVGLLKEQLKAISDKCDDLLRQNGELSAKLANKRLPSGNSIHRDRGANSELKL